MGERPVCPDLSRGWVVRAQALAARAADFTACSGVSRVAGVRAPCARVCFHDQRLWPRSRVICGRGVRAGDHGSRGRPGPVGEPPVRADLSCGWAVRWGVSRVAAIGPPARGFASMIGGWGRGAVSLAVAGSELVIMVREVGPGLWASRPFVRIYRVGGSFVGGVSRVAGVRPPVRGFAFMISGWGPGAVSLAVAGPDMVIMGSRGAGPVGERPVRADLSSGWAARGGVSRVAGVQPPARGFRFMITGWGRGALSSAVAGPDLVIMGSRGGRAGGRAARSPRPTARTGHSFNSRFAARSHPGGAQAARGDRPGRTSGPSVQTYRANAPFAHPRGAPPGRRPSGATGVALLREVVGQVHRRLDRLVQAQRCSATSRAR